MYSRVSSPFQYCIAQKAQATYRLRYGAGARLAAAPVRREVSQAVTWGKASVAASLRPAQARNREHQNRACALILGTSSGLGSSCLPWSVAH